MWACEEAFTQLICETVAVSGASGLKMTLFSLSHQSLLITSAVQSNSQPSSLSGSSVRLYKCVPRCSPTRRLQPWLFMPSSYSSLFLVRALLQFLKISRTAPIMWHYIETHNSATQWNGLWLCTFLIQSKFYSGCIVQLRSMEVFQFLFCISLCWRVKESFQKLQSWRRQTHSYWGMLILFLRCLLII